jgi:hypothetical protein
VCVVRKQHPSCIGHLGRPASAASREGGWCRRKVLWCRQRGLCRLRVSARYKRCALDRGLGAPPRAHSRGVFVCTLRGTPFHTTNPSVNRPRPLFSPIASLIGILTQRGDTHGYCTDLHGESRESRGWSFVFLGFSIKLNCEVISAPQRLSPGPQ